MVAAGYVVELVFATVQLVPPGPRHVSLGSDGHPLELHELAQHRVPGPGRRVGVAFRAHRGVGMLSMMGGGPDDMAGHGDHAGHGGQHTGDTGGHGHHGDRG